MFLESYTFELYFFFRFVDTTFYQLSLLASIYALFIYSFVATICQERCFSPEHWHALNHIAGRMANRVQYESLASVQRALDFLSTYLT